jgi:hypothetical protein
MAAGCEQLRHGGPSQAGADGHAIAEAFGQVITSGTMPSCWNANQAPVRPMPVWISSSIISQP